MERRATKRKQRTYEKRLNQSSCTTALPGRHVPGVQEALLDDRDDNRRTFPVVFGRKDWGGTREGQRRREVVESGGVDLHVQVIRAEVVSPSFNGGLTHRGQFFVSIEKTPTHGMNPKRT